MSFNKDKAGLQSTGSFRQRANQFQQKKQEARSQRGGGAPYFINQYKPSTDSVDMVRIIEGNYKVPQVTGTGENQKSVLIDLPFFPYAEHFDGKLKKSCICSAGPFAGSKEKAAPCHGCSIFWSGMERGADGKKKQGRMSRRELYAFTVVDYGVYHQLEQVDAKGNIKINEQTNLPYTNWEKCIGQGCDACQAGKPSKSGERRHWSMGWGHYSTLLDADRQIGANCAGCGSIDSIVSESWRCPACGDNHLDMATTSLKQKEIDELTDNPVACNCGYNGVLIEVIHCRACTPVNGTAKRATIFDVDMNVKRVAASDGTNNTTLSISRWSAPRPVDPNFRELAVAMDLAKTYAPTALDLQATLFQVPAGGVRRPVTASDASRAYGGGQQQQQQSPQQQMHAPPSMGGQAPMQPPMQPPMQQQQQQQMQPPQTMQQPSTMGGMIPPGGQYKA